MGKCNKLIEAMGSTSVNRYSYEGLFVAIGKGNLTYHEQDADGETIVLVGLYWDIVEGIYVIESTVEAPVEVVTMELESLGVL